MTDQTQNKNDHLILQAGLHPERLFLATMQNASPQFSPARLLENVQAEIVYWTERLATSPTGSAFLLTLESVSHAVEALKKEGDALCDLEEAVQAHRIGSWADASNFYTRAQSDLHFAISDWCHALCKIADDTPLDHYYGTRTEREKYQKKEPPRSSLSEMQAVSPVLFRAYQNMDRVFCLGVEVTQRQMLCLTHYLTEAEAKECEPESTQGTPQEFSL